MSTDLARLLRAIANGREEYASSIPESSTNPDMQWQRETLTTEAAAFRSAALLAEGHTDRVWGLLPTWRLTPEIEALAHRIAERNTPCSDADNNLRPPTPESPK
jgi:hypothetical protein